MIRKKLMGLSFTLGNLTTFSCGLINIKFMRFASELSVKKEDNNNMWSTARSLPQVQHTKFMNDLTNIINKPEIDLDLCMKFLMRVPFYENNIECLEKLLRDWRFNLLCEKLSDTRELIPSKKAIYILIQLSKLGIINNNPLMVIRYWARHIHNSKFITCVQMENLLVEVLGRSTNVAWTEWQKSLLARRLKSKFESETLESFSTHSIISAFNLMKAFGFLDLRISEILLKTLENQLPPNWMQIFLILTHFEDLLPKYDSLLQQAQKHIFEDIYIITSLYPLPNLIMLLEFISTKVYQEHIKFYDAEVVDVIVDEALRQECCFEEGFVILNHVSSIHHQHIPLLNYLVNKYEDNHPKHLVQLVKLFSYAIRVNCETTARLLLEKVMCQEESIKTSLQMLINVTYYMSVLDYYDQDLLETLFAYDNLVSHIPNYKVQRLISWLKIFYPSFPLPKLVDMKFENIEGKKIKKRQLDILSETSSEKFEKKQVKIFPLKSKLESLFGGPEYLMTNVRVRFSISVDHAVIFRQGGFPVAVNPNMKTSDNDDISLDRLSIPPNSHIILFQHIPSRGYVLNTGEINIPYKSYIKCIKELKYDTILVHQFEWNNVPDSERIPWLMRIIRKDCRHVFKNEFCFV